MLNLILVRGLPGSGKSSLAEIISPHNVATDEYFMKDGVYDFDSSKLMQAHNWCFEKMVSFYTEDGAKTVVVHNTFTKRWEFQDYIEFSKRENIRLTVISLFDNGLTDEELFDRCTHDVPLRTITAMRERFQHDWRIPSVKEVLKPLIEKYGDDAVLGDIGRAEGWL